MMGMGSPFSGGNMYSLAQAQQAQAAQQQAFLSANQPTGGTLGASSGSTSSGLSNNSIWFTTSTSSSTTITTGTTGTGVTTSGGNLVYVDNDTAWGIVSARGPIKVRDGEAKRIELPDCTVIDVKADGSYTIEDKDAKVIYRAARFRDFNPFINVSDRLEEFIEFCGDQGVRQGEMMQLPLSLFIGWLVIQAAKADKEPEPTIALLPDLRKRITPRCPACGRFTLSDMRARQIEFCAPHCFEHHYNRNVLSLSAPA